MTDPVPLPPPDLSTRRGVAAYRAELRGVAKGLRWGGLACVVLGTVLIVYGGQGWAGAIRHADGAAGLVLLAGGWALLIAGIVRRTRYHRRRMRRR